MFKNKKLEKLYNIALERDVSDTINAYEFILKDVESLTDDEFTLIELVTNMYTDVYSVSLEASRLILSIVQYDITNCAEMIRILKPYQKRMETGHRLGQPLSFLIRHDLDTTGLPEEFCKRGGRICTLRLFLEQLSSNLTLTNEYENFCIHSTVFDAIAENSNPDNTDFLENVVIDLSKCETATVGYLCGHWLYREWQKGRIIPNPKLKKQIEYLSSENE